jgi:hypothetical protein
MPNTQQVMSKFEPAIKLHKTDEKNEINLCSTTSQKIHWEPNTRWAITTGIIAALSVLAMTRVSEFLYFQF